jgi:hypothetical protein
MENRPRPFWQPLVKGVTAAMAILAAGAVLGGKAPPALDRPGAPEVQRGRERADLLAQGWNPSTPQRLIKPTYWPFVLGLGIVFLLGGIATRYLISGVGLFIFVLGMIGWIRDLLDEQESDEGV